MRLSTKLFLSFAGIICVILVMSGSSIFSTLKMNERFSDVEQAYLPALSAVDDMHLNFWAVRSNLSAMLLAREASAAAAYDAKIVESLHDIAERRKGYLSYITTFSPQESSKVKDLLAEVDKLSQQMGVVRRQVTSMVGQGQFDAAYALFDKEYRPLFRKLAPAYAALADMTTKSSEGGMHQAIVLGERTKNMSMALCLAAILVSLGITWLLTRCITRQLGKDPGELEAIARRVVAGDYDIDDGSARRGVYDSLVSMVAALKEHIQSARTESENARVHAAKATAAMEKAEAAEKQANAQSAAMRDAAVRLEEVAHVVSSASTQLSAQIEQADSGAVQTAHRLGEAAAAMNEMNATVQEVAKNAGAASAASTETKSKAEHGASIVRQSLESIELVHTLSMGLKDDMAQLDAHAQNISQIMTVISDIADQTNLLALNAAIEAARAGEAGRGFAVVADEVRKLAEKTMASTNDVGQAIKAIQESTATSLASMDNAVGQVDTATDFAKQSGQALEEILVTVASTSDQVNAIAAASEQQSAASDEINHTISEVNEMSSQTAEGMTEAAKAVSDLAAQANRLSELIADMRAN